jgi:hypothetical protein
MGPTFYALANALNRRAGTIAFAAYVIAAIALTWPLVLHLGDSLFGDYGDRRGQAWAIWSDVRGLRDAGTTQLLSAPYGTPVSQVIRQPFHEWPLIVLARYADEITAINIVTILSFPLTATAMFLLLRRLTSDVGAAFFGGLAFGFCPAAIFQAAGGHGEYAMDVFVPLFVLALFHNRAARTRTSGALVGAAFASVALVSVYMAYFCVYFALAFAVFDYATSDRGARLRIATNYLECTAFAALAFIPFHLHAIQALIMAGGNVEQAFFSRRFDELFVFSARPIDYVIPSIDHPVFGRWAEGVMRPRLRDNAFEQTLYLGLVPLSLIALGLWATFGGTWKEGSRNLFLFFVAAGAWMCVVSFPPEMGELPGVSKFAYPMVPMFRVYARAGIVVAFCVACAAALAWAHLSRSIPRHRRHAHTAMLCALLAFEFWSVPPGYALPVNAPPRVYEWLAKQPPGVIVAEYPMVAYDESSFYSYPFWQRLHGKRLVNGATPGNTDAWAFYSKVRDLANPQAPGLLKSAGVNYVIVHKGMYAEGPIPYALKRYYTPGRAAMTFDGGVPPPIPEGLELYRAFGADLVFVLR